MFIKYEEGPDTITAGIAGQFQRGESKEVDDKVGAMLLKKKTIKFKKVPQPSGQKEG